MSIWVFIVDNEKLWAGVTEVITVETEDKFEWVDKKL